MRHEDFVKIARALADPTRATIVRDLRKAGELRCGDVCERFSVRQSTISHHIKTLVEAGIVASRRDGQFHVLTLNEDRLAAFARWVSPEKP